MTERWATPRRWAIGLDSWVLQDGNYTEFEVGQRRQFALEFYYHRDRRLREVDAPAGPECRYSGTATDHDVTAHLRLAAGQEREQFFVLDFGLLAYTRSIVLDDLEPPPAGSWLHGTIGLAVDPFDYMDLRFRPEGLPPMIYTWTVEGIERATTPRVRIEHGHALYLGPDEGPKHVPDPDKERWEPVGSTPVWDGSSYRLHCLLEPAEAVDTMAASGPGSPYGPLAAPGRQQG